MDIASKMFAGFSCIRVGKEMFLTSNTTFKCWTRSHIFYSFGILLPVLIIFLLIPSFCWIKNLKNHFTKNFRGFYYYTFTFRYCMLFYDYKRNVYYYEFIKMTKRILIVLSLMTLYYEVLLVLMIIILINIAFEHVESEIQPY